MAAAIQRGSNCRLKFKVLNDVDLTTLGMPAVAIAQEYAFITPSDDQIHVDNQAKCVYVDLDEEDTLALAENASTRCQLAFVDDESNVVVRFPVHDVIVVGTLMDSLL
jgi:hypothetical protein